MLKIKAIGKCGAHGDALLCIALAYYFYAPFEEGGVYCLVHAVQYVGMLVSP